MSEGLLCVPSRVVVGLPDFRDFVWPGLIESLEGRSCFRGCLVFEDPYLLFISFCPCYPRFFSLSGLVLPLPLVCLLHVTFHLSVYQCQECQWSSLTGSMRFSLLDRRGWEGVHVFLTKVPFWSTVLLVSV